MTRDKASKTKIQIPTARDWCNQILPQRKIIFNDCLIVKSHKMDRMAIVKRARAVGMLVSGLYVQ